jgi:hypothetical protein
MFEWYCLKRKEFNVEDMSLFAFKVWQMKQSICRPLVAWKETTKGRINIRVEDKVIFVDSQHWVETGHYIIPSVRVLPTLAGCPNLIKWYD